MKEIPPLQVFEGVEKRIEVRFSIETIGGEGLRTLTRDQLDQLCERCKCSIIHHDRTDFFDSYILSESSLFVFVDRVMIKTCGTTVPLDGVDYLIEQARINGIEPLDMTYTRSSFLFPDLQLHPHNDLDQELDYLSKMSISGQIVPGKSSILGDANGKYWLVHYKDLSSGSRGFETEVPVVTPPHASCRQFSFASGSGQVMVDVIMTGLDKTVCDQYFKDTSKTDKVNADLMADSLRSILPEFDTISGKCYDPCGYSCNAFRRDRYFTVHITPEQAFSYASVEAVFMEDIDASALSVPITSPLNHLTSRSTVASDTDDASTNLANNIFTFIYNVTSLFNPKEALVTMLVKGDLSSGDARYIASQLPRYFSVKSSSYAQIAPIITSENLLGEDIVASSVFYSSVTSGNTGNKPPGLS